MRLFLIHLWFFIISISCFADENVVHLVGQGNLVYEKLSRLSMQNTLIESAKEYEKYGHVARATHHDMAYPIDPDEYVRMGGFGILWVTSHSQIKDELPIKNLRILIHDNGTIYLDPIYTFPTEEKNQFVAKVLGKYRSDSIYMIPFFEEEKGAMLLADYSANRKDFKLGGLENEYPPEVGSPIKLPGTINYPNMELFNIMLDREYPIAKDLIAEFKVTRKLHKVARFVRWTPKRAAP